MNLATTYMGIPLRSPMVVGSSPLTEDLDMVRRLEDEGAAALVLPSLYEEEIIGDQMSGFFSSETYSDSFPEATSYNPEPESAPGPSEYLEHLYRVKQAVSIPAGLCRSQYQPPTGHDAAATAMAAAVVSRAGFQPRWYASCR